MKILFTFHMSSPELLGRADIVCCIDLNTFEDDHLAKYVCECSPVAMVATNLALLQRVKQLQDKWLIHENMELVYLTTAAHPAIHHSMVDGESKLNRIHLISAENSSLLEIKALQYLEDRHTRSTATYKAVSPNKHVACIGAGIVNLITAWWLVRNGYNVTMYSGDPEPCADGKWKDYGCTFSGNDARIFSFNESRHHHYRGNPLIFVPNDQYRKSIADGGWLSCDPKSLSLADWTWIEEYEAYPQWVFQSIQQDIIAFNKESYAIWREWTAEYPELLEQTGYVSRLFRVYSTVHQLQEGIKNETEMGAFIRELSPTEVLEVFPILRDAIRSDAIGGVIEVEGFSVHIHELALKLISMLKKHGVSFNWNESMERIHYNDLGRVSSVCSAKRTITSDYFVVSPGVPRNDFLTGTRSHRQIGAMLGCWITLLDEEGQLTSPIKVTRIGYASEEAAAGANIIPGKDSNGNPVIHISSGHGFLGLNPNHLQHAYIRELSRAVHETALSLFPQLYRQSQASGFLESSFRYCIRPWTPTCLGLYETIPTENGGLFIVTGGHNTGGFTQSMVTAKAVQASLEGVSHPMHRLYHPDRLKRFFAAGNQEQWNDIEAVFDLAKF
ncbi:NAD(P)/FAD-dependent oxidoreductase [Paenibacillus alvei]|uniref:NAD(P)/FAD-dependent oxidoreductase n=1 Tax=Paenibacillus alvei TaxID=44250 RepID=UPI0003868413|nr:FAD-dependent oxidoreductase [Paenibacillus alvei]EPY13412.1 FAD dependent oxidoreductase [Paenibacillus alvei A6-6i-x]